MTPTQAVMLHYGCREHIADMLIAHNTEFARAARFFGGLRCYYSKRKESWTLDQRIALPRVIIGRYQWQRARDKGGRAG